MKNKKPFFSIITVVKNDQSGILKTIKSILNQNFKNFEYIIIDGGSSDKTYDNVLKHQSNIDIILSEKDDGLYYAMNKGAALARGEFIVFVNSGDTLTENALLIIYNKTSNKNIDFVFGSVKRRYTTDTILKYGYNKQKLLYNFDFATSHSTGFFVKLSEFRKIGYFNTKYKCSADYDAYFKLLIKQNLIGTYTDKDELIGEVSSGGFSSKFSFISHLIEESKIRFDNQQNFILIILIFLNAIIKKILKEFF